MALWFGSIALLLYLLLVTQVCLSRHTARLPAMPVLEDSLLIIGLCFHAVAIFPPLLVLEPLRFGAAETFSLTAWLALATYLIGQLYLRIDGLQPAILSFTSLFLGLSLLLPEGHTLNYPINSLARSHFLLAMLSYGLFANAAAIALLMKQAEHTLHHPTLLMRDLPPLLTLEKLLFLSVGAGFVLLTLALGSGMLFAETLWGKVLALNHKTLFSGGAWLIFGSLLAGRRLAGWRGQRAANWTIAGFLFLMLGYLGTRFVLEVLLQRV